MTEDEQRQVTIAHYKHFVPRQAKNITMSISIIDHIVCVTSLEDIEPAVTV